MIAGAVEAIAERIFGPITERIFADDGPPEAAGSGTVSQAPDGDDQAPIGARDLELLGETASTSCRTSRSRSWTGRGQLCAFHRVTK
jgi:hypothetical protein